MVDLKAVTTAVGSVQDPELHRGLGELRLESVTAAAFLDRNHYSPEFVQRYFIPLGSAIWSCAPDRLLAFPIRFIVQFYRNHGFLQVRDQV